MYRVPVRVGEELNVTIEAVGEKGDGIAKKNGFILFVPGVKQGDKVRIRVVKVLKKVGFAEVIKGKAEKPAEEEAHEEVEEAESQEEAQEGKPVEDTEDFGDEESGEDSSEESEESFDE